MDKKYEKIDKNNIQSTVPIISYQDSVPLITFSKLWVCLRIPRVCSLHDPIKLISFFFFFLYSPQGTKVQILKPRKLDDSAAGFEKWKFMSVASWGEDPRGSWFLDILDEVRDLYIKKLFPINLVNKATIGDKRQFGFILYSFHRDRLDRERIMAR